MTVRINWDLWYCSHTLQHLFQLEDGDVKQGCCVGVIRGRQDKTETSWTGRTISSPDPALWSTHTEQTGINRLTGWTDAGLLVFDEIMLKTSENSELQEWIWLYSLQGFVFTFFLWSFGSLQNLRIVALLQNVMQRNNPLILGSVKTNTLLKQFHSSFPLHCIRGANKKIIEEEVI